MKSDHMADYDWTTFPICAGEMQIGQERSAMYKRAEAWENKSHYMEKKGMQDGLIKLKVTPCRGLNLAGTLRE
jgi:hypothetical protein